MEKPRIVVEEGPLAQFFSSLPDTVLAFIRLQNEIEYKQQEREKDRQFKESQLYLKDLINTKQSLYKGILDLNKVAATKNLSLDRSFDKLAKSSPKDVTPGGGEAKKDFVSLLQQDIDHYTTEYSNAVDQLDLAGLGERIAIDVDRNFNSALDPNELAVFQKENPEFLQDLGLKEFPKALIAGVENHLLQPKVRENQQQKKNLNTALNIMQMQWDFDKTTPGYQEDPSVGDDILGERRQARIAYKIGDIPSMKKHIIASENLKSTDPTEADLLKLDQEDADLEFRTAMDIYQDQITRTSKVFRAKLPWAAGQDFKKGAFISNPGMHKENLEKTLEGWFTEDPLGPGPDTARKIRMKYKKYYEDSSNVGTEAERRAFAVESMFTDSDFLTAISTDKNIESNFSFGERGNTNEEQAQIEIFRTTLDMYRLASKWSGFTGGGISKILKQKGITMRGDTEIDPWLKENYTKGNR